MTRVYGVEFPERALMSVLSDLLGIAHFTTARGSTVRKDFVDAVAAALGVAAVADMTKDEVLLAAIAAASRTAPDPSYLSPGSTVTDRALQAIINGVTRNGVPGLALPAPGVDVAAEQPELLDPFPDAFDPAGVSDERTKTLVATTAREGQDRFRTAVLLAYGGRCAVTGANAPAALEAAHIVPYMGPGTNRVSNGLALRADVHRLFDRGALAVHERDLVVLVKGHLLATTYGDLAGRRIALPGAVAQRPAPAALRDHRLWAGL